jgi:PDZ domain-containing protein
MNRPPEPPAAAPDVAPPGPPDSDDETPPSPRTPLFGKVIVGLALLIAVVGVVGANIELPYVIFSPGDATPVDDYVRIKDAKTYDHAGSLLLLTVRVSNGRPNLWRFIQASLDDDSKVEGEDAYLGNTPRKAVNRQDVQAMATSQLFAQQAALARLGYDVTVTGKGASVEKVYPDSPAATAGLKEGDVITSINGQPVRVTDDVGTIVRAQPVGTEFTVVVQRAGKEQTLAVTSAAAPSGDIAGKPYFGIAAGTVDLRVDFPVKIKIATGDVSGPSGGLAFTLTIIDDLSPGNLTGGKKIAVTGTIDGSGRVGEVGGVPQKAVAARNAGAKLMIVPRAEVRDARSKAGDMKVVGVDTLDQALAALRANGGAALPARVG